MEVKEGVQSRGEKEKVVPSSNSPSASSQAGEGATDLRKGEEKELQSDSGRQSNSRTETEERTKQVHSAEVALAHVQLKRKAIPLDLSAGELGTGLPEEGDSGPSQKRQKMGAGEGREGEGEASEGLHGGRMPASDCGLAAGGVGAGQQGQQAVRTITSTTASATTGGNTELSTSLRVRIRFPLAQRTWRLDK